jgi:hypothetical protein
MTYRMGRKPCPICRDLITNNALGRASHVRACEAKHYDAKLAPDPSRLTPAQALALIAKPKESK